VNQLQEERRMFDEKTLTQLDPKTEQELRSLQRMGAEQLFSELVSACGEVVKTSIHNRPPRYACHFIAAFERVLTVSLMLGEVSVRDTEMEKARGGMQ
jgi:hypothetical protein